MELSTEDRDFELYKFIALFGMTYSDVLGLTFFNSVQVARNRVVILIKQGFLKRVLTGLGKPRYCIILTFRTKRLLLERGFSCVPPNPTTRSTSHLMLEQISYFHLMKIGSVEKKSTWKHHNTFFSVPDFVLHWQKNRVFIEVETTLKSKNAYLKVVSNMVKDNPSFVLYICNDAKFMRSVARAMPLWDSLYFIDIDTLIYNIREFSKVSPFKQATFFKEGE